MSSHQSAVVFSSTRVPPTRVPPTRVPPTSVPPTSVPPTRVPPTHVPPTAQHWEHHKEFIRHLYINHDMPLKEVMEIMLQRYGFSATVKMYKTRLSKWNLAKNNNRRDMEKLARHIVHNRRLTNLEQRPRISGKPVNDEEVKRYFRRRGFKSLEEAVEMITNGGGISEREDPPSPPPPSISFARSTTELVLKMVKVYYTGCCETGLWYTCTAGRFRTRRPIIDAAKILDRFVGFWVTGLEHAKNGSMPDCYRSLIHGSRKLPRIIQAEHPSTIRAILEMLLEYTKAGQCPLAISMIKQIARLSRIECPIGIICRQILRVQPGDTESMALAALACGADTLATQCGAYHYSVVRCRVALITLKSTYLSQAQIAELANQLLMDFARSDQFTTEGYLSIADSLLENLCDLEAFAEAEAIIEKMKWYAQGLAPERTLMWMMHCAQHLSRVQFSQQKYESAEQNCRYFIQERIASYGPGDSWALASILRLSSWLRLWNRFDEALVVDEWGAAGLAQAGCELEIRLE